MADLHKWSKNVVLVLCFVFNDASKELLCKRQNIYIKKVIVRKLNILSISPDTNLMEKYEMKHRRVMMSN